MPRPKGSKNKVSVEETSSEKVEGNEMKVDLTTYTNKIAELENQLLVERQRVGNLTIKLAETEANYLKIRKRCANIETQLLKKK